MHIACCNWQPTRNINTLTDLFYFLPLSIHICHRALLTVEGWLIQNYAHTIELDFLYYPGFELPNE